MPAERASESLAALALLVQESVRHWGLGVSVQEAPLVLFDVAKASAVLTVEALHDQAPMRWLLVTAKPDPLTLRTQHYCSSVLHVLRTIRQVLDAEFRPGNRFRMGTASLLV